MTTKSKELTEVLSLMVAKQPFFTILLFDLMQVKEDEDTPTAKTDGRTIWVGPWFRKLPLEQRLFVLCHEVYHCIFQHLARAKLYHERGFGPDLLEFDFAKWNRAGDYYINNLLTLDKVGVMPPIGLLDQAICSSPDAVVDDIYMQLPPEPPQDQGGKSGNGTGFDEHVLPAPGQAAGPTQAQVQAAVISARNTAKATGKMPGNLDRVIGEILEPVQKWQEVLRDYVTATVGKDDTSWARPNRRRLAVPPHVPFPGTQGFAMGSMVVAVDTSGSISDAELAAFLGEMKGILEQVRPRELWVAWWDTSAVLEQVSNLDDMEALHPQGGGGTNYSCVEPALVDAGVEPEVVVCMTDGAVAWPSDFAWPQITVTTGRDCPFGRSIYMDITQDRV